MTKKIVPALLENLEHMIDFVRQGITSAGLTKKEMSVFDLICEEWLLNIIKYAYPEVVGDIEIEYHVDKKAKKITLVFTDTGIPFDPNSIPNPDLTVPIEEREPGGLGIYMIRKKMGPMIYKREQGKNILTLSKNYG